MTTVTPQMAAAIKDTMAVIVSEATATDVKEVRQWLDTVKTAEDFFGSNRQGLAEYKAFIQAREAEYMRAVRNTRGKM